MRIWPEQMLAIGKLLKCDIGMKKAVEVLGLPLR